MALALGHARFSLGTLARSHDARALLAERLATGKRVNRGADDPAALGVGAQLGFESRALRADRGNIAQGEAALRIVDGALGHQQDLLVRAGELATQAGNGLLDDAQRRALDAEFQSVVQEIDRIAATTSFNGRNLLGGTTPTEIQVRVGPGADPGSSVDIAIAPSTGATLGGVDPATGTTLTLHDLDASTVTGAGTALSVLNGAVGQVSRNRASLGASFNRLETADRVAAARIVGTEAARSQLLDLDVPRATTDLATARTLERIGIVMLGQLDRQRGALLDLLA
jgi:flagellin